MMRSSTDLDRALLALEVREMMLEAEEPLDLPDFNFDFSDPPEHFGDFVRRRNPTLFRFEHIPTVVQVVDRWVRGEILRLLVHEPPRYLKSEIFSRLLPAYIMRHFPRAMLGLASYGAALAWALSEQARDYFVRDGGTLSATTAGKQFWKSAEEAQMWAIGAGGPALGFGYHFGIVDDPLDPLRWASPTRQQAFKTWWPGKFLSRQEPDARIALVMQRLGRGDPFDFLFAREVGAEGEDLAPENWHVLFMDEIHSLAPISVYQGPKGLPETCTLEPDPREEGEVLAPSRYGPEAVKRLQRTAGSIVAAAQRQGRPIKPEGDFWKKGEFQIIHELPPEAFDGGWDWDLAETKKKKNAASAGIRTFRGLNRLDPDDPKEERRLPRTFPIFITEVWFDWLEFPELVSLVRSKEGPHYVEAKSAGKPLVQSLEREGLAMQEVPVDGNKLTRATAVQPIVSNGRVFVLAAAARVLLEAEKQGLLTIRAEDLADQRGYLDVNDVFVQALARHDGKKKQKRVVQAFIPGQTNGSSGGTR